MVRCITCDETGPEAFTSWQRTAGSPRCRSCYSAYNRARYKTADNARKKRDSQFRCKYGITHGQYDALLWAQDGVCATCRGLDQAGRRLAVDHCHTTGEIRGLLCAGCNLALGGISDNPTVALELAAYLERLGC